MLALLTRLPRWLKWPRRPPPPPAPQATSSSAALLVIILVAYLLTLIRLLPEGSWRPRREHAFLVWPTALGCFLLSHAVYGPPWDEVFIVLNQPPAYEVLSNPIHQFFVESIRRAALPGFALLLFSELSSFLFIQLGPLALRRTASLRHPVMCTHTVALLYYLIEPSTSSYVDVMGRPIFPLRYLLWLTSVSSMVLSIYYVCDAFWEQKQPVAVGVPLRASAGASAQLRPACVTTPETGPSDGVARTRVQEILRKHLVHGLLSTYGTFGFGYLAGFPLPGGLSVNVTMFVLSGVFFYVLLYQMSGMLQLSAEHPSIRGSGIDEQFRVLRIVIVVAWHIFPVAWLLAIFDLVDPVTEHAIYVCGDLVAKYLLLFVYVAAIK